MRVQFSRKELIENGKILSNRINIYEKTKIITCDIIKDRDTKELLESEHPFFAIPLRSVSLTFDL